MLISYSIYIYIHIYIYRHRHIHSLNNLLLLVNLDQWWSLVSLCSRSPSSALLPFSGGRVPLLK